MMVSIRKVNNYMFRPKAAIFRLSQLQFCSKSVINGDYTPQNQLMFLLKLFLHYFIYIIYILFLK